MDSSTKKGLIIIVILIIILVSIIGGYMYFRNGNNSTSSTSQNVNYTSADNLNLNMSSWNYDSSNDVYWQIGIIYCSKPETKEYESLGIYVPGKYFNGEKNSDGTYTCTVNKEASVGKYTATTAPIVFPVNTAGYSAQAAPTSYNYNGLSDYMNAGLIYVYAGMRGRDNGYDSSQNLSYSGGAPWPVTDLKAAIRYYRYNATNLPGNTESIFTFGMSGGGAQSALAGATGDSSLYDDYLNSIGAITKDDSGKVISDAVCGSMCWCPITSLDYADEAYEWNMGQYATSGTRASTTWTSAFSKDLAKSFGEYINKLGLKDSNGNTLTLEQTSNGIYTSGTYYNYMLSVIQESLNNFLKDTTFPYTPSNSFNASGNFGGGGPNSDGGITSGNGKQQSSNQSSTTYQTVEEYINSLNSDTQWIKYDSNTNTATITSIEAFVTHCKNATKDVGAFDSLSRSQAENNLFGNDSNDSLHFDYTMAQLLKNNSNSYSSYSDYDSGKASEYENDLTATDKLGKSIQYRQNMYNPMYYLSNYYEGNGTSKVAKYWRIRTGINQGDTALTVETNLALALKQNTNVKNVDFETVWGMQHTMAERTGNSTTNFISWIEQCVVNNS